MASAKAIEKWLQDLREGTAKKRDAAARQLAHVDPATARAVLLEVLASAPGGSRKPIGKSLLWVADVETARTIAADRSLTFMPDRLAPPVLAALYDDLRRELPALDLKVAQKRLAALHVLELASARAAWLDNEPARPASLVALLVAVLDEPRLIGNHAEAADALRRIDSEPGSAALLRHWTARTATVDALSASAAWSRLGCPSLDAAELTRLMTALLDELSASSQSSETAGDRADAARLDARLRIGVARVPAPLAIPLLVALERHGGFPEAAAAVATRVLGLATDTDALLALLDDRRLTSCHRAAAESLMTRGPSASRAVVERGPRLDGQVLAAALAKADPTDIHALLVAPSATGFVHACWYDVVIGVPGALRDPRWLALAPHLPDHGRKLHVAIAQDPRNDARGRAIAALSQLAAQATDRLEKRHALYALGETGHPAATTALVAALDDHDVGDSAPLICTALAKCGDTRAIPVLERRLRGPHKSFVQAAIDRIRERASDIHASVLLAACQDEDPALADLARQARDGDTDAAVVLEDALRERGRL